MKIQLSRFRAFMEDDYEFVFPNGPRSQPMDPGSPQARILHTFFEGLPVLRWMLIVDKATGKDADIVGRAFSSSRQDKRTGQMVDLA